MQCKQRANFIISIARWIKTVGEKRQNFQQVKLITQTMHKNTQSVLLEFRISSRLLWPNNSNIKSIIPFRMFLWNIFISFCCFREELNFGFIFFGQQTQLHQLKYVWIHLIRWKTARYQKEEKMTRIKIEWKIMPFHSLSLSQVSGKGDVMQGLKLSKIFCGNDQFLLFAEFVFDTSLVSYKGLKIRTKMHQFVFMCS